MSNCSKYDPALRQTEHGSRLYEMWKRMRKHPHCEEWDFFPAFYTWAMENGYEAGKWMRPLDKNKDWSPSNVAWYVPTVGSARPDKEWENTWNNTVNRIRKHYGMPPLEGTSYADI